MQIMSTSEQYFMSAHYTDMTNVTSWWFILLWEVAFIYIFLMYAISLTKFATGTLTAVSIALKVHPKLIEPILPGS